MSVYQIQITGHLWDTLVKPRPTSYVSKDKAIAALKDAFQQGGVKFTIKEEGTTTLFKTTAGVELAKLVLA